MFLGVSPTYPPFIPDHSDEGKDWKFPGDLYCGWLWVEWRLFGLLLAYSSKFEDH